MRTFLISLALAVSACSTPKIADPTIKFPNPPAELMKEPPRMEPIE